jgi:hypothetical protein
MYKLSPAFMGNQFSVIRTSDGACIPFDPANTDYQAYLHGLQRATHHCQQMK